MSPVNKMMLMIKHNYEQMDLYRKILSHKHSTDFEKVLYNMKIQTLVRDCEVLQEQLKRLIDYTV